VSRVNKNFIFIWTNSGIYRGGGTFSNPNLDNGDGGTRSCILLISFLNTQMIDNLNTKLIAIDKKIEFWKEFCNDISTL